MDRGKVDADRERTCSAGLHVAAWNYAESFYFNGHLLEVEVNPRDVVAVPTDYNNEKMRTCEYKVVRVAGKPRTEPMVFSEGDTVEYVDPDSGEVIEVEIVKCKDGWPHRYDVRAKDDGTFLSSIDEERLRWIGSDEDYDDEDDYGWGDDEDDYDGWGNDDEDDDDDDDDDGDYPPVNDGPKSKSDRLRSLRDTARGVVDEVDQILSEDDDEDDGEPFNK
jgi:hypothetical protein